MKTLTVLSLLLMVVGALNWLLVGLLDFNLVTFLFGSSLLSRLVYALVGLAGLFGLSTLSVLLASRSGTCVPGHAHATASHGS